MLAAGAFALLRAVVGLVLGADLPASLGLLVVTLLRIVRLLGRRLLSLLAGLMLLVLALLRLLVLRALVRAIGLMPDALEWLACWIP